MHEVTEDQIKEAVTKLEAMTGNDPESDHGDADVILEALMPPEVREALVRLKERCYFWVTA